jgi:3-deoxy-manno-octulosonate cytidylyltransferase (CMP-KDO synthetase)
MKTYIKATVAIPARIESTRLPRKMLLDLEGKSVLQHTWERVIQMKNAASVIVVTDDIDISTAAHGWGAQVLMSSPDCENGTARIASVIDELQGELILNVQGDEPFVDPKMLDGLVDRWNAFSSDLVTSVYPICTLEELTSFSVVKVARAHTGQVLYFSRSAIPHVRDVPMDQWLAKGKFWGHIGVYGFKREVLSTYPQLPPSPLEKLESLEQLRFLEAGYTFQTFEATQKPLAIDFLEDLEQARVRLRELS